jgi:hypothetical protein
MHSLIAFDSMHFSQKYHDMDRQARLYRGTRGLPGLGNIQNFLHLFSLFFQKKEGMMGGGWVWIALISCSHSSGSFVLTQKQKD